MYTLKGGEGATFLISQREKGREFSRSRGFIARSLIMPGERL